MPSFMSRIKRIWNAFSSDEPSEDIINHMPKGPSYSVRPDRIRLSPCSESTIATAIYNRIAMDCANVSIRHVQLDENNRYLSDVDSRLNECLTVEANLDQTSRAFMQDLVLSLMDEGVVAVVPTDATKNIILDDSYDVITMRCGKIIQWYPKTVQIRVYDENTGQKKDIILPKKSVAIIENPLYSVINEKNSVMQRLLRKLALLDVIDEQNGSGKLNLIIQLPYIIKTEARKKQAEKRRAEIESQLAQSKYGIAYTDGTEKVTQLGGAIENKIMAQIEYLTRMLYSQLGITQNILDGSADENTMTNYMNRTIEPIISAITSELTRKFITKTGRTQGKAIMAFKDPFKLLPVNTIAQMADAFTRNEIMTSNEFRQIIGMPPSSDPNADVLRNKNLSISNEQYANENNVQQMTDEELAEQEMEENQNG